MKVKLLKNFKSCKMSLKEGQIIIGSLAEQMDQRYSLAILQEKGIIEILHEENLEQNIDESINEKPLSSSDDFSGVISEMPKRKYNKKVK